MRSVAEILKDELRERVANDLGYHPATDQTAQKHEAIRGAAANLSQFLIAVCPVGRELSSALTAVQEACMWANAAVAVKEAPLMVRDSREVPSAGDPA